jgi:hypothetical protein
MARTLLKGDEVTVPTSAGLGVSFTEATVVRLVNTNTAARVITVKESRTGTGIGTFTMLPSTTELLEKVASHIVFASAAGVLGAKVGFTG